MSQQQVVPEQLQNWIAQGRDNPKLFINKLLGLQLHKGQIAFITLFTKMWYTKVPRHICIFILTCANRWGKAQPVSEPVLTPAGYIRMGDIKVGDTVFSQDGTQTKVVSVHPQGTLPIYRFTFDDGSYTRATEQHLWRVMTGMSRLKRTIRGKEYGNYQKWQTLTTKQLLDKWYTTGVSNHTKVAVPVVEPLQFNHVPVTIDPYVMGAILGDGCLRQKMVTITSNDPEITERIAVTEKINKHSDKYTYDISKLMARIDDYGLTGRGSLDKFIPDDYLRTDVDSRLALLQGLMDTDGSINTKNKKIEFNTVSPQLAEGVKFLVQSLGGKVRVYTRHTYYIQGGKKTEGKLSYRLSIDIHINPFYLSRKATSFNQKIHHYSANRLLVSITPDGEEEAQCITVDHPSHLYVTRDCVVTHNSVTIACIQLWFLFYKVGIPEGDMDSWLKTEYRTANIAPHSALTEPVFKTMHQILTSSFSIRDQTGKMTTNQCLVEWWYIKDRTINTPPYKQFFDNNAYIEHRSLGGDMGDALQGKPYGLITYDEGGRSDHLEEEMDNSIIARLFDMQGPFFILSTPSTTSKSSIYYYKLYQKGLIGVDSTYTMTGSLRDNDFFSEEQIQSQYDLLKDNPLRDQMLEGKFVFGGNTMFDTDSVLAAQDPSLNDGVAYLEGHRYVFGIDSSIGSDEIVYTILDVTTKPFQLVAQRAVKGNSASPTVHMAELIDLITPYYKPEYGSLYGMLETWNGESVRFYHDMPPWLQQITQTYGSWNPEKMTTDNKNELKANPNNSKKADMLMSLRKLLDAKELKIPKNDEKLANQLAIYREEDAKLQTDRVMALALAVHRATEVVVQAPQEWNAIAW